MGAGYVLDEEAFAAVAGEDCAAYFAAFEGGHFKVQAIVAFLFFGAVAFVAVGDEEGFDVFFEIDCSGGGWGELGGVGGFAFGLREEEA